MDERGGMELEIAWERVHRNADLVTLMGRARAANGRLAEARNGHDFLHAGEGWDPPLWTLLTKG